MQEFEASLNSLGFDRAEATSPDADPSNPKGSVRYVADSLIDWSLQAEAEHQKSLGDKDEYARSRVTRVRRETRTPKKPRER